MSTIYVYSPSGAVRDKAGFRRALARLRAFGHMLEIDPDALTSHQRFAGSDEIRLQAFERAAASGAQLALMTRGGYGITRLLPRLNYQRIAQSVWQGTCWMGYSDFTALQAALFAKTGCPTESGASLMADFGAEEGVDDIMQACFDDALLHQGEGAGWRLPKTTVADRTYYQHYAGKPLSIEASALWGGNLAVLTSLIGTPYLPQIKGGILWFEDTGETPYRIERMLTQWLHAGLLHEQQALLLGRFTDAKLYPHDRGFNVHEVVARLRAQLNMPILTGLPFGHVPTKVMLPFGKPVRLLCDGAEAMLLWDHELALAPATPHSLASTSPSLTPIPSCCDHAH